MSFHIELVGLVCHHIFSQLNYMFIFSTLILGSIGKEHESTSLKALLDQIPGTKELTTHAKTAKWHLLGVQLELDDQELRGCSELVKMYDLWLNNKAEMATRRNLLKALRFIKENKVAWEYENYLKTKVS